MDKPVIIEGFSSMPLGEKWRMAADKTKDPETFLQLVKTFRTEKWQEIIDRFSENTLTGFPLPYSLIPNVRVNDKMYLVPMVTEESSVVAAAASAAKFWAWRSGFTATTTRLIKEGQIHFFWDGDPSVLKNLFNQNKNRLLSSVGDLTKKMRKRGGGILDAELLYLPEKLKGYYQLRIKADTVDAMGANFINTVLETIAQLWKETADHKLPDSAPPVNILMSILSNYTPECRVKVSASCPVERLATPKDEYPARVLAERIHRATVIAQNDLSRAVTHNKGIFNGIDAVALATGNDFRAIEAAGHAWATHEGSYRGLTRTRLDKNTFSISLELPLAVGTTGGVTTLHPLAEKSMEILGNPSASELMMIMASVGLASNFAALRSLVSGGIQKGHMRMHLNNLLMKHHATPEEQRAAEHFFADRVVSDHAVQDFLINLRHGKQ